MKETLNSGAKHENGEIPQDLKEVAKEAHENIRQNKETLQQSPEKQVDQEALEAKTIEVAEKAKKANSSKEKKKNSEKIITKAKRNESYKTIMSETRSNMSAPGKAFSNFIHSPAVEKVSEVAGATIARPNAILSGSIFALVLSIFIYIISRHYGYVLSGFEVIGAFLIGWLIGLLVDFFTVMARGK